jgi:hypothetical protein
MYFTEQYVAHWYLVSQVDVLTSVWDLVAVVKYGKM